MAGTIMLASSLLKFALKWGLLAAGGALSLVAGLVLMEMYRAQMAYLAYKRKSRGLPMLPERNLICNHTVSWGMRKNGLNELRAFFAQRPGLKTVGSLVRANFVATTIDLNLMKRILLDEPNRNINRLKIGAPASEYMEDTIMLAEDEQWRRLRRAVAPALKSSKFKAPNVMRDFEASMEKLIGALEEKLAGSATNGCELGFVAKADELIHRYTLDLMFRSFYKQPELIDFGADHCHWTELVDEGLAAPMSDAVFKLGLTVHALRKPIDWLIKHFHRQGVWRREIMDFIRRQTSDSLRARKRLEQLKRQAAAGEGQPLNEDNFLLADGSRFKRNLADHITDHLLDGKISAREYANTAAFLIIAADKTAADSLVHTIYRLAVDSKLQERLRDSIRSEGANSTYLEWVLCESLRLLPPVSAGCGRLIVNDLELEDGKLLPAGTMVGCPAYLVHRLSEFWGEDADEFKPERWRDTSRHHPLQWIPFGAGVRACPGRDFAMYQMRDFFARLLPRYKFQCAPKADAYVFDSPFSVYMLYNSPTYIKVTRA